MKNSKAIKLLEQIVKYSCILIVVLVIVETAIILIANHLNIIA